MRSKIRSFLVWAISLLFLAGGPILPTGCAGSMASGSGTSVYVRAGGDDYDFLMEYGAWVDIPPYGMCWRPAVSSSWQPFSYGHWVWSDGDWLWVSYEPYGWLVYHYGYWNYQPGYGWYWVPGTSWSPARVVWYTFDDYTAWAPMPPRSIRWDDPWVSSSFNIWVVVKANDFARDNISRYRVTKDFRSKSDFRVIKQKAPARRFIEDRSQRTVATVEINREKVKYRDKSVQRMVLPPDQSDKVKRYGRDFGYSGVDRTPDKQGADGQSIKQTRKAKPDGDRDNTKKKNEDRRKKGRDKRGGD